MAFYFQKVMYKIINYLKNRRKKIEILINYEYERNKIERDGLGDIWVTKFKDQ